MKKLSNEEKWNIAQQIAKQLPEGADVKNMSKADLAKYNERCNLLVEHPSQYDGKDYEEEETIDYFLTLVKFHVAAYKAGYKVERDENDHRNIVRNIVQPILDKDDLDGNEIIEVSVEDNGYIIEITFTGAVAASIIMAIGEEFGDNEPDVYGVGDDIIKVIVTNHKHQELHQ